MEPSPELHAVFALLATPGVGRTTLARMRAAVERVGRDLSWLLGSSLRERIEVFGEAASPVVSLPANCTDAHRRKAAEWLRKLDLARIPVRLPSQPSYPAELVRCLGHAAPSFLCVLGQERWDAPRAAVVGARLASARGLALARQCGSALAEMGVTLVSGGADGVDLAAHAAALLRGGRTIVTLPQGILGYRPPSWLWKGVLDGRALIISECLPDDPWSTPAAVTRNATISAVSRAVCVIEPRKTGGSVRTARSALAHGRPVFVWAAPDARSVAQSLQFAGARPLIVRRCIDLHALRAAIDGTAAGLDLGAQLPLVEGPDG